MKEIIEERIKGLTAERTALEASHSRLVQENQAQNQKFQEIVTAQRNRWQQLQGAIAALTQLKEGKDNDNVKLNDVLGDGRKSPGPPNRVPDPDHRSGHNRRTRMGNRKLDKPNPAPSKTGDSAGAGSTGDPVGS